MVDKIKILIVIVFSIGFYCKSNGQEQNKYATNDGTWCWFSDPRAIMVNGNVLAGWVKADGTIEAGKINLDSNTVETTELYYKLEADDHNNPAFLQTADGKIIVMYTRHSRKDLFINTLPDITGDFEFTEPEFIHPFSDKEFDKFPRKTMTYANPVMLKSENNRIYCFGRWTGFKPNMMWSNDGGVSWTKSKVFITNYPFDINNRPYVKYFSDGESKIHIVFTDGHPRDEAANSVYYACYEKGAFFKASGELICPMAKIPFEPKDASVVYTSDPIKGRAWIADIGQDKDQNPVILYTKSPNTSNHEYWYAHYTGKKWVEQKICDSGKWFPQTPDGQKEWEAHYFGGLTLHPDNTNVVYLSRQVNGRFEIERWQTKNGGKTWKSEALTQNSTFDNVRPYVPRGLKADEPEVVLFMENQKYIHYTNFRTSIKYYIRK